MYIVILQSPPRDGGQGGEMSIAPGTASSARNWRRFSVGKLVGQISVIIRSDAVYSGRTLCNHSYQRGIPEPTCIVAEYNQCRQSAVKASCISFVHAGLRHYAALGLGTNCCILPILRDLTFVYSFPSTKVLLWIFITKCYMCDLLTAKYF